MPEIQIAKYLILVLFCFEIGSRSAKVSKIKLWEKGEQEGREGSPKNILGGLVQYGCNTFPGVVTPVKLYSAGKACVA